MCAVAGVYRTGKSFILNQLAGKSSGFSVGGTVQAHTKGIWMWGAPLQLSAPGAPDNLLLLDTEGLQSLSATEGHDAKIFSLAILLASSFLYNSEKAINNAAIDQLSLVAQLTQRIRAKSGRGDEGAAALASEMPDFLWLLRDFQLELKDEGGRPITKDEYLDEASAPAARHLRRRGRAQRHPRGDQNALPAPRVRDAAAPDARHAPRRRRTQEPAGAREARTAVPRRRPCAQGSRPRDGAAEGGRRRRAERHGASPPRRGVRRRDQQGRRPGHLVSVAVGRAARGPPRPR